LFIAKLLAALQTPLSLPELIFHVPLFLHHMLPPRTRPGPSRSQVQKVVILIIPALPPINDDLLLFLVLGDSGQEVLKLGLGDFLAQLAGARERDEPVLDVGGARFLDEADATEAVCRFGVQDLVEDRLAGLSCVRCVSVLVYKSVRVYK
jgi:hypothetical protein